MRTTMRMAPVLCGMALVLVGCGQTDSQDKADPSLPRVTLEVRGMS